jgi:hypothetical protein
MVNNLVRPVLVQTVLNVCNKFHCRYFYSFAKISKFFLLWIFLAQLPIYIEITLYYVQLQKISSEKQWCESRIKTSGRSTCQKRQKDGFR